MTARLQTNAARVRAVIVNYNGADLTLRCVQSLAAQDCAIELETIVVDNHSSEEDWRSLRHKVAPYPVILHRCAKNLGYAGGINAGASLQTHHTPEYILALNSDITLPGADAVRQLVAALREDPRRVACSPLIRDRDCPAPPAATVQVRRVPDFQTLLVTHSCWLRRTGLGRRLQYAYLYKDFLPYPLGTTLDCETINGACFMLDRRFLEAAGYLDDRTFLYGEELTLGALIRARNATACLCTTVIADHIQGASTNQRRGTWRLKMLSQQVRSELHYARTYLNAGPGSRLLLLAVRTVDILIKGAARVLRIDT
jgi:GT2 family glycosyltransferase